MARSRRITPGRLNEAARLYANRMLDPEQDVTICLTIAGAMTPAGVGGAIIIIDGARRD